MENTVSPIPLPTSSKLSNPRPLKRWIAILVFIFSFLFFLYATFPFGVLKESLMTMINKGSSYSVRIGKLYPSFPVGLGGSDVEIIKMGSNKSVRLQNVAVRLSLMSLLIGRLRADITLYDATNGRVDAAASFGLFSVLRGAPEPKNISMSARSYPIGGLFDFALAGIPLPLEYQGFIGSYLEKIAFTGKLNAEVDLGFNSDDPSKSTGEIDISLNDGSFTIEDPSLALDPQKFSKFLIKAKMAKGQVMIDPTSAINSQDLAMTTQGQISLKKQLAESTLDVTLQYRMEGSLRTQIGELLDTLTGGTGGESKWKIGGTFSHIQTSRL